MRVSKRDFAIVVLLGLSGLLITSFQNCQQGGSGFQSLQGPPCTDPTCNVDDTGTPDAGNLRATILSSFLVNGIKEHLKSSDVMTLSVSCALDNFDYANITVYAYRGSSPSDGVFQTQVCNANGDVLNFSISGMLSEFGLPGNTSGASLLVKIEGFYSGGMDIGSGQSTSIQFVDSTPPPSGSNKPRITITGLRREGNSLVAKVNHSGFTTDFQIIPRVVATGAVQPPQISVTNPSGGVGEKTFYISPTNATNADFWKQNIQVYARTSNPAAGDSGYEDSIQYVYQNNPSNPNVFRYVRVTGCTVQNSTVKIMTQYAESVSNGGTVQIQMRGHAYADAIELFSRSIALESNQLYEIQIPFTERPNLFSSRYSAPIYFRVNHRGSWSGGKIVNDTCSLVYGDLDQFNQ